MDHPRALIAELLRDEFDNARIQLVNFHPRVSNRRSSTASVQLIRGKGCRAAWARGGRLPRRARTFTGVVTIKNTSAVPSVDYLAVPVATSDRPGPWPGVVLVHDLFGPGDDMKEQVDWLAAAGYLTAMPDLYSGRSAIRCVQGSFRQLLARRGPVFDRLEQARSELAANPDCTGTVGIIGYCIGGGFALLLAGRTGWDAAAINYGELPEDLDAVLATPCPIVASFGGKDRSLPRAAAKLEAALARSGVAHDVKEYQPAGHGFINRLTAASPLTPLMKVFGVGYDHDSAADAKRRILDFFDVHLRQAAPSSDPA